LLLNFDEPGGPLSEIVLTHRGDAKAEAADKSCLDGLSGLREKWGALYRWTTAHGCGD